MNIEQLKQTIESCRSEMKCESDTMAPSTESGAIGVSVVDAIVAAIESQELRIVELESRLGESTHHGTFPSGLESKPMHDQAVALQWAKETAADKVRDTLSV